MTIGAGITIRGSAGDISTVYYAAGVVNQGMIAADDSGGVVPGFVYDTDFSGGWAGNTAAAIDTVGVSNAAPAAVYQTARGDWNFSYTLGNLTAGASYTVVLQFAEIFGATAGQRQFNVSINGVQVLTDFDIAATAGGLNTAVAEVLPTTADGNGVITITFIGVNNYALVNGIELEDAGGNVVQAINCGEMAGATITINPSTFTNQGTLAASNGGTLTVGGTWSTTSDSTISVTGGTLNLGGVFPIAPWGTFNRSGGTVNLVGTLNNTGTTLALNGSTGSWNLLGGTIRNGIVTEADGAELLFTSSGGVLDGVTADSDLDLATNYAAYVHLVNGLTLNSATVWLGNAVNTTYGQMFFDTTETLGGTGKVVFGTSGSNGMYVGYWATLTIGPGITVRGSSGHLDDGGYWSGPIDNQGTIAADGSGGTVAGGTIASTRVVSRTRARWRPAMRHQHQQPSTWLRHHKRKHRRRRHHLWQFRGDDLRSHQCPTGRGRCGRVRSD